jgi:two-component system response regulator GlrR
MNKVLVVDDDLNLLKIMRMRLEAEGYQIDTASDAEQALQLVSENLFDLALIDLKLGDQNGIEVMERCHGICPGMPVIILTAYGTIKSAVEAMHRGAVTYLTKPFEYPELLQQIKICLNDLNLESSNDKNSKVPEGKLSVSNIIGKSKNMQAVFDKVVQAGESDSTIHIQGESGTGKELIANVLHNISSRQNQPFVAINCAAIPENLLESELFGFKKGAFTGAERNRKGLFTQAHGGTLFLDEISEMPLTMQAKLLRVLEERKFYPLGGEKPIEIDIRLLTASNRQLEREAEEGTFRKDLFYRIHVIPIYLPPLRERKEDIMLLANHFFKKYTRQMNRKIRGFSGKAIRKLLAYTWPGNVRQLENTVEYAITMATQNVISADLILPDQEDPPEEIQPLKHAKENFEKDYLVQLMEFTQGNVSQASKLAGKYRADLYELLRKYDLKAADFRK